jgi:uncharacterized repeat protein (TIGR01451 family)
MEVWMRTKRSLLFLFVVFMVIILTAVSPVLFYKTASVSADPSAISFTQVNSQMAANAVGNGQSLWGDYDNDGDLDVLLIGCIYEDVGGFSYCNNNFARVYHNVGGIFNLAYTLSETYVGAGVAAWGDYDNDGDLDIVLSGSGGVKVYQNTGSGFSQVYNIAPGVDAMSLAWGDYNNDGRRDILLGGWLNGMDARTLVYRNTGSGFVLAYTVANVASNGSAWGDYDNDGKLDILLTGDGYTVLADIYRNTGSGFSKTYSLGGMYSGGAAWGDYDNDGDLDIVLSGSDASFKPAVKIYENTGSGFSDKYTLSGLDSGSADWGDYDNDGDLDLLLTGQDGSYNPYTQIYENTGSGFSLSAFSLTNVANGTATWGDYDNDGDLDVLLNGCTNLACDTPTSQVYRNDGATANSIPNAPGSLNAVVDENTVTLSWTGPSDGQTPTNGLNYNLYVAPSSAVDYTFSPMANVNTGYRRVPALGNIQGGLTASLTLPIGDYNWNVQAVDSAWAGGAFAPGIHSFSIVSTAIRYVTKTGTDSGNCATPATACQSIAYALSKAAAGNTIQVAAGTYTEKNINIDKSITIMGDGAGLSIIQAGGTAARGNGRIFKIANGVQVTLEGLTLKNGWTNGTESSGGAIANYGTLTVRMCAILDNTVEDGSGGGLFNDGTLTVINSTLAGNRAYSGSAPTPDLGVLSDSLWGLPGLFGLAGLSAAWWKRRSIKLSRFSGAAVSLLILTLLLTACYQTQTKGAGGAIYNYAHGVSTVRFSSLAHNSASTEGGAVYRYTDQDHYSGSLTFEGSLLSQNTARSNGNCGGDLVRSSGYNVSSDASCKFGSTKDRNDVGDQAQALQANGSAPLLSDSIAINNVTANCPANDQVKGLRSATCDAGAVEFNGTASPRVKASLSSSPFRVYVDLLTEFKFTLANIGPAATSSDLDATFSLPTGLTLEGAPIVSGGTCTWSATTLKLTCPAPLEGGNEISVRLPVRVNTSATYQYLKVTATGSGFSDLEYSVLTDVPPPFTRYVGPSGKDEGTCLTVQNSCKTIAYTLTQARSGDSLSLAAGTYNEYNLVINKSVNLQGAEGAGKTIIDAQQKGRVFVVEKGATVLMDGLTIQNGKIDIWTPYSSMSGARGGGIYNAGVLTVTNSVIRNNSLIDVGVNNTTVDGSGGGLYNEGTLTVTRCLISGNSIHTSTQTWGGATSTGGGIYNQGDLAVSQSVLSGNTLSVAGNGRERWAVSIGGGITNQGSATLSHVTISGNKTTTNGGGIHNNGDLTIEDSIIWANQSKTSPGIYHLQKTLDIQNSVLQAEVNGAAGGGNTLADPLFVRNAGKNGPNDWGNLHLQQNSPVKSYSTACSEQDLDGTQRQTPDCSTGAYEYQEATANGAGGDLLALQKAADVQSSKIFATADGPVTLDIPAGAVSQTVKLAFSLGQPTDGDGREKGVVFSPYDAVGNALPDGFTFLAPMTLTLGFDPAQVRRGALEDLVPMRYAAASGQWLPFTNAVVLDKNAFTVSFPITQCGEYGLFSLPAGVYVQISAASPNGVENLAGGATVTYTLTALNATRQAINDAAISHTLPDGLSFVGWTQANGATQNNGAITWTIDTLAAGGLQSASFTAQVSSAAQYQGTVIQSTVNLTGAGGISANDTANISINAPVVTTPDSVTTAPDTQVRFQPMTNDENPDASPLTLVSVSSPAHGSASVSGDSVIYTPTAGYVGSDSFSYTVQDGAFNVSGTIEVRVARLASLSVLKTVESNGTSGLYLSKVAKRSLVTYTLQLYNAAGGEKAQGVTLTDVLPAGVQFKDWVTQSGAVLNGSTITWTGEVAAGEWVTIRFRAEVTGDEGETVSNVVQVSAANADPVAAAASMSVIRPYRRYLPLLKR